MSPVGSAACVSCLLFNQYSVDSSHSCSFKHKLLIFLEHESSKSHEWALWALLLGFFAWSLINIRLIRVIRVLLKLKCFVFLLNHKCFVFHPQATRTSGPNNPCSRCYPCETKHKPVSAAPKIYRMIRYILVNIYNNKLQKIELVIKEAINYLFRSTAVER